MRYYLLLFCGLLLCSNVSATSIVTPYPETIELKQINSAEKERARLAQWFQQFDRQPTGFYIEAGKEIVVNVEILTAGTGGAMPQITIGTPGFTVPFTSSANRFPENAYPPRIGGTRPGRLTLTAGINRITPTYGGLIHLSFINGGAAEPTGEARITFTSESQHVRAPRYVYGVTSHEEFIQMLDEYQTPDVLFHSDTVVVVASRTRALSISSGENKDAWIEALHLAVRAVNRFSGMDRNDPNPVHHLLKGGQVRYLLSETHGQPAGGAHANHEYTGYHTDISTTALDFLSASGVASSSAFVAHELGHQHQQRAYLIQGATEGSVHAYVAAAQRVQGLGQTARVGEWWWGVMQSFWQDRSASVGSLRYEMSQAEIGALLRYGSVMDYPSFIRMVWEQLTLIFGEEFYHRLHRVTREEGVQSGGNEEQRAYLIWKASQVTGYDLTDYFNHWGIRVTDTIEKPLLRSRIYTALVNEDIAPLPLPVDSLLWVSGQRIPEWAPLSMAGGMTSSKPRAEILAWEKDNLLTPSTPYQYRVFVDPSTGVEASHTGDFYADEDSELVIEFEVLPGYWLHSIRVNGEMFYEEEEIAEGSFVMRVPITNHTSVLISARQETSSSISKTFDEAAIHIYPNPVKSGEPLFIDLSGMAKQVAGADLQSVPTSGTLTITGIDGRTLYQRPIRESVESMVMNHPPGIYILHIALGAETAVYKLVLY